jgi:phosphoribosylpyrophosphate synthetase
VCCCTVWGGIYPVLQCFPVRSCGILASLNCFSAVSIAHPVLLLTVQQETGKIKQLTVGPLLAQCISNIHNHKSISALFK